MISGDVMRLLFDRNLSPRLTRMLDDLFPLSIHVQDLGLDQAADTFLWAYAISNNLVIVTKDKDLRDLSVARGYPPKVVRIELGNCPTQAVESLLRERYDELRQFYHNPQQGLLTLP